MTGLYFPFVKIDAERRLVRGVAQAEKLDETGEVLEYSASKKAFRDWLGNIREMHDRTRAVGKGVEIQCDDSARTITVTAYISRGAEDTWTKITEGVLRGFSIAGSRVKSTMRKASEFPAHVLQGAKRIPKAIRYTSEWIMTELSLVDSPALPQAIFEVVKTSHGLEFQKRATPQLTGMPAQVAAFLEKTFGIVREEIAEVRTSAEVLAESADKLRSFDARLAHLERNTPRRQSPNTQPQKQRPTKAELRNCLRSMAPGDPRREALEIELLR